jgi:hypothetical protein
VVELVGVVGFGPFVCSVALSSFVPQQHLVLTPQPFPYSTHSHLVRFLGIGAFDHTEPASLRASLFMAEEFVGTMSLKALLRMQKRCRLAWLYTEGTALRWAAGLAGALAYLHSRGYVHGDVKVGGVRCGWAGGVVGAVGCCVLHAVVCRCVSAAASTRQLDH